MENSKKKRLPLQACTETITPFVLLMLYSSKRYHTGHTPSTLPRLVLNQNYKQSIMREFMYRETCLGDNLYTTTNCPHLPLLYRCTSIQRPLPQTATILHSWKTFSPVNMDHEIWLRNLWNNKYPAYATFWQPALYNQRKLVCTILMHIMTTPPVLKGQQLRWLKRLCLALVLQIVCWCQKNPTKNTLVFQWQVYDLVTTKPTSAAPGASTWIHKANIGSSIIHNHETTVLVRGESLRTENWISSVFIVVLLLFLVLFVVLFVFVLVFVLLSSAMLFRIAVWPRC